MLARVLPGLKISALLLVSLVIVFLGLNVRQLFSDWMIGSETRRLENLAQHRPDEFQNPAPATDHFDGKLSPDFWKFSIINGAGRVSNASSWHAAALTVTQDLTIQHLPDPAFKQEDSFFLRKPAAGQYNNVSLIGGSGFRPSPTRDIVLQFNARVSAEFYGTAGVIFQPMDILQPNGLFVKPFDMFGFSVIGEETSVEGMNGPICYLALQWLPVEVNALPIDPRSWHTYELRLRWISNTQWLGSVKVDQVEQCQIHLPAFGAVEVHVWSDNSLPIQEGQHWWEIAPALGLKFENGGEKLFQLDDIQISAETR